MNSTPKVLLIAIGAAAVGAAVAGVAQQHRDGYTDTPILPGQKWHVHDPARPYPPEVIPGMQGRPSSDALVLFDGHDISHWTQLQNNDLNGAEVPRSGFVENAFDLGAVAEVLDDQTAAILVEPIQGEVIA